MPIADINPNDKWVTDDQGNIIGVDSGGSSGPTLFGTVRSLLDSNGNVVGLLGPNGEEIPLKRISAALSTLGSRMWGMASVANSASVWTTYTKQTAECDFDAVQLVYYHHGASTPTGMQVIVAATETSKTDSVDNLFEPIVGGTKRQAKDSTTEQYGWRSVTWGGAASPTIVAAAGYTTPTIAVSDWIPLASVPRAAGEENSLPLIMIRSRVSDAAAQNYYDLGASALMQTATADNNGRIIQTGTTPSDGVGTINDTNRPAALGTTRYTPFGIRYRARKSGLCVLGIGSSLVQNQLQVTDSFSAWGARGCAKASTPNKPISWWNNGFSSQASSVFNASGLNTASVMKPNVIVYEAFSPNDYATPTAGALRYAIQIGLARAQSVVEYCNTNRIACILMTGFPHNNGLSASADDVRKLCNTQIKAMAAANAVYVFDVDALVTDGASPADFLAAYDNGDGIHINNAGNEVVGVAFAELLNGIL